jgi:hypothetical protein
MLRIFGVWSTVIRKNEAPGGQAPSVPYIRPCTVEFYKVDFTSRLQLVVYGSFHVEGYVVLWACSHLKFKFKCEQAHKTM